MTDYKIETGIPVPEAAYTLKHAVGLSASIRKLADGPIGNSFGFPHEKINTVRRIAHSERGSGWAAIRKSGDTARIWKIAEPSQ